MFDGKTLEGWQAPDMSYWSVEDGAITAKITKEHPCKVNQYLVWQGGDLADFELKITFRMGGSPGINGGFQFRSRLLPDHDIAGYQMDNNLNTDWLCRLYEEHGRETLAMRGTKAVIAPDGKITRSRIEGADGPANFKLEDWHEYDLLCVGSHLTLKVNGSLVAEVIDDDPQRQAFAGVLGLQLHSGPPMTVQFKDILLKVLKPASAVPKRASSSAEAKPTQAAIPRVNDKTLVAWVAPADLAQRGGSALTIDDGQAHFDGIVFGELTPAKWMPGSDSLPPHPEESRGAGRPRPPIASTFVQMAIVYHGREVTLYRNGTEYARYTMSKPPQAFGPEAIVLFGRRHLEAGDPEHAFAGRIKDARIYDQALEPRDHRRACSPGRSPAIRSPGPGGRSPTKGCGRRPAASPRSS